jgi:hypothetical protein
MKKVMFLALMIVSCAVVAQPVKINVDTSSFIKPGVKEVILDTMVTNNLEPFRDNEDAVIYIYRMKSMAGAAVKWQVKLDTSYSAKLSQMEYIVAHINTSEKGHSFSDGNMTFNYINFKPHTYYKIRLRGFSYVADYLDAMAYKEIKECREGKLLRK